jgi:hypothetical protein
MKKSRCTEEQIANAASPIDRATNESPSHWLSYSKGTHERWVDLGRRR